MQEIRLLFGSIGQVLWCFERKNLDYQELWTVIKRILILSHGNASVESGFSITNDLLVENLQLESMMTLRLVHDSVRASGGIKKIDWLSKHLLLSFRSAYSRYQDARDRKGRKMKIKPRRKSAISERQPKLRP